MDFTGLLSSQGNKAKMTIAETITTNPRNFAVRGPIGKVIALNMA